MLRGLYTAASGMLHELVRNDTAANNLAGIDTAGYKKDLVVSAAFPELFISRINDAVRGGPYPVDLRPTIGTLGAGVATDTVFTVHTPGKLKKSDNPLDLAIFGEGYFAVRTPAGEERYTRCGLFTRDAAGALTTAEGFPVLDTDGNPVTIAGTQVSVSESGEVSVDGSPLTKLKLVDFTAKGGLAREGTKLFAATAESGDPAPVKAAEVRQGYLEASNVEPVLEMVNLITVMRTYEANQKAVQAQDQMLDKAVNEIARI